ncbi:MAG: peptidylprolyl isomerase [Planctomycetes bacterium]|nr:peptidylprolyl isomerase [Planctomycetota bacterium]
MAQTHIKVKSDQPLAASADKHRDLLPRTGAGAGQMFVESFSKFLASNGKILAPIAVLLIVGVFVYYGIKAMGDNSTRDLKARVERAAIAEKPDALKEQFEQALEAVKGRPELEAYARYRYAMRSFDLLKPPYKPEELQVTIGLMNAYLEQFGKNDAHKAQNQMATALRDQLQADHDFITKNGDKLPFTKDTKVDKPAAKKSAAPANPVVVFKTSVGDLRVELFEDAALNGVKNLVSLVEEGYYDRIKPSALEFSNQFSRTGDYRGATVIGIGKEGRPKGVKLEKPAGQETDEKADVVPQKTPYTIEYSGDTKAEFVAGSIAFARDIEADNRVRGEFFVVIEPSDYLKQRFSPLGKVLDGEKGLEIARRLDKATVYYAYVEQQREGTEYKPQVIYTGWPAPMVKRDEPPKPLRFNALTQIIDDKANPMVVIELESGDVVVELKQELAPNTVKNFISLIEEGFYNKDCEFYRVEGAAKGIAEIMKNQGLRIVQGGREGTHQHDYVIKNEAVDPNFPGKNTRGTIAMARTNDLDSASTEFYINLKDNPAWDKKTSPYTVFGEVIQGLELLEEVKKDDAIKSIKIIRKRSGEYLPTVKYKDSMEWGPKKKVEPPKEEPKKPEGG